MYKNLLFILYVSLRKKCYKAFAMAFTCLWVCMYNVRVHVWMCVYMVILVKQRTYVKLFDSAFETNQSN